MNSTTRLRGWRSWRPGKQINFFAFRVQNAEITRFHAKLATPFCLRACRSIFQLDSGIIVHLTQTDCVHEHINVRGVVETDNVSISILLPGVCFSAQRRDVCGICMFATPMLQNFRVVPTRRDAPIYVDERNRTSIIGNALLLEVISLNFQSQPGACTALSEYMKAGKIVTIRPGNTSMTISFHKFRNSR